MRLAADRNGGRPAHDAIHESWVVRTMISKRPKMRNKRKKLRLLAQARLPVEGCTRRLSRFSHQPGGRIASGEPAGNGMRGAEMPPDRWARAEVRATRRRGLGGLAYAAADSGMRKRLRPPAFEKSGAHPCDSSPRLRAGGFSELNSAPCCPRARAKARKQYSIPAWSVPGAIPPQPVRAGPSGVER